VAGSGQQLSFEFAFRGNMPVTGAFTAFWEPNMNSIVYLVGLIVIVLAILSFVGIG
jgi:hypothetical protein